QRVEEGSAEMKIVCRKLKVEKRIFPLFVLGRGRQYVVCQCRGLCPCNIYDDHEIEGTEGLFHRFGVGRRIERVRAIHPHRADTIWMIVEYLGREAFGRVEARDLLLSSHGRGLDALMEPYRMDTVILEV